jgi:hypothetical protein
MASPPAAHGRAARRHPAVNDYLTAALVTHGDRREMSWLLETN